MARASKELIIALRETAAKLENSADYQWGHMGACNCGYLAQTITRLSRAEIHAYAMRKSGDWAEQVSDYCSTSKMPFDLLVTEMLAAGFEKEDLIELERLSNPAILQNLDGGKRYLNHNRKQDVVDYMKSWASLLEKQLPPEPLAKLVLLEKAIIFEEVL